MREATQDCECGFWGVGKMQPPGTGTGTGTTRRAVVRSEKFMEWQREISRSVSAVRKLGHTSALLTTER